jgi:signal transduction histidine kinase/CheY-like chemotaxis protein
MSLSVRFHLALILVGLNIAGAVVVALFAYRISRQTLEQQALAATGAVAAAREQSLDRLLEARQERLNASLTALEALCGERNPRGTLALERGCMRAVLIGLQSAERANAIELRYASRRLSTRGSWHHPVSSPAEGALAAFASSEYTMSARHGRLSVRARFPTADLVPVFDDRSGLDRNGEVLLVTREGSPLTQLRYATQVSDAGLSTLPAIQRCAAGETGEMLTRDYRNVVVISAFRPVPAIGDGCVVANFQYSDALVPIDRLRRTFGYGVAAIIVLGILLSLIVSHAIAKPITRLAASARRMAGGDFDQPTGSSGPSEIRLLARAFTTMGRSIGDLVRREQAARVNAEEASRLKDAFLATLSHELRTPLTAILGWSSMIRGGITDPKQTLHAVQVIERNAQLQARLVDDLLDVSRMGSGQMRLQLSTVSLAAVLDETVETMRPAAEAKNLELVTHIDGEVPAVRADADRLQQVVWNLLSNAVRFTPTGGRIDVSLRAVGENAEICVADTGIGLPADFLPYAFEPFRQADSGTTREHGGLGLGLAIVRHIVELHGGTVRAASPGDGQGASFIVTLPIQADVHAPLPDARPNAPMTLRGTHILVVDDDPDTRNRLRAILEEAGATVATTASAGETRTVLGRQQPDLLIADLGMRDEDGYSLIRSVRALETNITRRVPAIALTTHARAEDVDRALASGFQVHMAKPVQASELVSAVATLVHPES